MRRGTDLDESRHDHAVSFMSYDPGYIVLEQRTLQTIDAPVLCAEEQINRVHRCTK
jgi:hypothetical protein